MFGRKKADTPTAEKRTEDPVSKRQEQLTRANETRMQATQALTKAAKETKIAFHKEVDRIIEGLDKPLKAALKKAKEPLETNVSRTYVTEGNPELLGKFQQISGRCGIINIKVEPAMGKIHVRFEIAE
jgi:hypothetical protein